MQEAIEVRMLSMKGPERPRIGMLDVLFKK